MTDLVSHSAGVFAPNSSLDLQPFESRAGSVIAPDLPRARENVSASTSAGASTPPPEAETEPCSAEISPRVAFTVIDSASGPAAKSFSLSPDGSLIKQPGGQIWEGRARQIEVEGLEGFLKLIDGVKSNQALVYGVSDCRDARLVTNKKLEKDTEPGAIARDKDHFAFAEDSPGMLMLDHDPRKGHRPMDWRELDRLICGAVPVLRETARSWRPSSSAFIYRTADDAELIGLGGWRCYLIVDSGAAIPAVGAGIYQALWEAGHGYISVSQSGQVLDRSLVDAAVWQPERLDFAAPPVLGEGLGRRAPDTVLLPGKPMLQARLIASDVRLGEWRRTSTQLKEARERANGEIKAARDRYVRERVAAAKSADKKVSVTWLKTVYRRAAEDFELSLEFPLTLHDGTQLTVAELLADPAKFDGERFADPLEPDYRSDRRISVAMLQDSLFPAIWSHARGGQRYALVRERADIRLISGHQPRAVDEALAVLRDRGDIFERGGEIVRLTPTGIEPVTEDWLLDLLARDVRFFRFDRNGNEFRCDPPSWIARRIKAKLGERNMKELKALITAPTMRPDGTVLATPGYDEETGLFLRRGDWPSVPEVPTEAEMRSAAQELWRPFAKFPFVDNAARAVHMSALLTGVTRHTLPLAPAVSYDAPAAGTGKTLLAQCVQAFSGMQPEAIPECRDEEEFRKKLLAALRTGNPAILFDNIRGQFSSPALEACLTTEFYCDRVLGSTQMLRLPTSAQFLISGNNFRPAGDLWRRILTCRIDAKIAAPERRSFALNPLAHCQANRQKMVAAALTLLQGYILAGAPRATEDRLASYEAWDDRIRQAVIWLGQNGYMPEDWERGAGGQLAMAKSYDPAVSMELAKAADPENQKLSAFLAAAWKAKEGDRWKVAQLVRCANNLPDEDNPLFDILDEIAGERRTINPRILGRWIERNVDRRCDGLRLEKVGTSGKTALWRIVRDSEG